MKRIAAFMAAAALICTTAAAEIDLSGMTYDELIALNAQVTRQIMMTDKWQEVEVPVGVYKIGRDIPAGKWTIKPIVGCTAYLRTCIYLNDLGTDPEIGTEYAYEQISEKSAAYAAYNPIDEITWDLKKGQYLIIHNSPVIITPFAGLSFSFK